MRGRVFVSKVVGNSDIFTIITILLITTGQNMKIQKDDQTDQVIIW